MRLVNLFGHQGHLTFLPTWIEDFRCFELSMKGHFVSFNTYLIQGIDAGKGTLTAVAIILMPRSFIDVQVQCRPTCKAAIADIALIINGGCVSIAVVYMLTVATITEPTTAAIRHF